MSLTIFIENLSTSTQSSATVYDWWKDIIIPLVGTIGVPLVVWLLTRHYGADKAEERKELKELRDNLNLLTSIFLDCIAKLDALRKTLIEIKKLVGIEENIKLFSPQSCLLTQVFTSPTNTNFINVSNYSYCISYSRDYVITLLKIIAALEIKDFKLERRNFYAKNIDKHDILSEKEKSFKLLVEYDRQESEKFIVYLNGLIIMIRDFINQTNNLKTKIKDLKIEKVTFNEEQMALFKEIEEYNKKIKG